MLWSQARRQVALIELTAPWEVRVEEAHERKLGKYQSLISESLESTGGLQGVPGTVPLESIGDAWGSGATRKNMVNNISKQAETASRRLWLKRSEWLAEGTGVRADS